MFMQLPSSCKTQMSNFMLANINMYVHKNIILVELSIYIHCGICIHEAHLYPAVQGGNRSVLTNRLPPLKHQMVLRTCINFSSDVISWLTFLPQYLP